MENNPFSEKDLDELLRASFLQVHRAGSHMHKVRPLVEDAVWSSTFAVNMPGSREKKLLRSLSHASPIRWSLFLNVLLPVLVIFAVLFWYLQPKNRPSQTRPGITLVTATSRQRTGHRDDNAMSATQPGPLVQKTNSAIIPGPLTLTATNDSAPKSFQHTDPAPRIFNEKYKEEEIDYSNIPELTQKEIDGNNIRKQKMIKALLGLDRQRGNGSWKDPYTFVPSGKINYMGQEHTVQAFFIQKTEVSNLEYRTFLYDLVIQGKFENYLKARVVPQSFYGLGYLDTLSRIYFTDPKYNDYPVVNIPRIGAVMYCQWLTEEAGKEAMKEKGRDIIADLRLPMEEEWTLAARGGSDTMIYAAPLNKLSQKKKIKNKGLEYTEYEANYNVKGLDFSKSPQDTSKKMDIIAPVYSYFPNKYDIYNMSGNVAEMVWAYDSLHPGKIDPIKLRSLPADSLKAFFTKRIMSLHAKTKGGSYNNTAEYLKIDGPDAYDEVRDASPYIGFRPVITFLGYEKKKGN